MTGILRTPQPAIRLMMAAADGFSDHLPSVVLHPCYVECMLLVVLFALAHEILSG
jgi:hypothetical protein